LTTSDRRRILEELGSSPSVAQIRQAWPILKACLEELPEVRIAVAATYTVDPLVPYLGWHLARRGFALNWTPAPFNQLHQQLLDPSSALRTGGRDVAVVLPRIEELLPRAWAQLPVNPQLARDIAIEEIGQLINAIRAFLQGYTGLLLAGNFVRPEVLPLALLDHSSVAGGATFTEWLNQAWRARLSEFPSVRILDVAGVLAEEGHRRAADPTRWYLGRIPFREPTMHALAGLIARYVHAWLSSPKKVIVLDCDGTLWGGIVGEDGPGGIAIGEDAPGNAYAAWQDYILGLQRRGVLVALCSKNNEEDVWAVFSGNRGMRLKKEDLSAWRINWERKSANLRAIAQDLNLGVDSLVMVDDSPVELAEVQSNLPEVQVVQLSEDPADFIRAVEDSWLFDRLTITGEDLERHKTYAAERKRDEVKKSATSLDDYLQSLGLTVSMFAPTDEDLPRVAQLIERTNQFNLTTRRRSEAELRLLAADPNVRIHAVRVRDRFGEYGLTGAAIVQSDGNGSCTVDTFLLSCRVLARGVEDALMRRIADHARAGGSRKLRARFIPTKKNAPAAPFLNRCGFGPKDTEGWQVIELPSDSLTVPPHITVVNDSV
jgi:FkbH-like protein